MGFDTNIDTKELNKIKIEISSNPDMQLIIDTLINTGKIRSRYYLIITAEKIKVNNVDILVVILKLDGSNGKIIYTTRGKNTWVLSSIVEKICNKNILYCYEVIDGSIQRMALREYDETFQRELAKLNNTNLKQTSEDKSKNFSLPCIYGNWCGPFCSGPGEPIDEIDTLCKQHDLCYGDKTKSKRYCDKKLIEDLKPYVASGNKWAIVISWWFGRV
jgi:hypothetical protein